MYTQCISKQPFASVNGKNSGGRGNLECSWLTESAVVCTVRQGLLTKRGAAREEPRGGGEGGEGGGGEGGGGGGGAGE